MQTHVMVDLETMGIGSFAAIISIGAVKFDPNAAVGEIIDSFEATINLSDAFAYGQVTASTVEWWMSPERTEARNAWLTAEKSELFEALDGFANWFGSESLPVWGNGAPFDNVILRNAYSQVKLPCPWNFRDDRCFRTMKNVVPLINPAALDTKISIPHVALSDALYQTFQLQTIFAKLRTMETAEADLKESRRIPDGPLHGNGGTTEPGTY